MDAVQEIKSRLDIADIVGEYLPIKPAGSGAFKALCPFHHEKTPSFYISRPRQSWHCFGCDQGGDLISFVEKMEGMEFKEVMEFLAGKTGILLPKFDGEKASMRKRLHEVNDLAVKFFRGTLLQSPAAEPARVYLQKRGVDELTADLFLLGYAPAEWSALTEALIKKGVTADELLRAGLVSRRENGSGVYDRFRGRLMFPIADVHGNIVGFTGRILIDDNKEAKYVNTPETALYRKSAVLYGLDKAKGEIRRKDQAIIVEGNMDVIGSHQFHVTNVVASSGTALTAEQLALLKRFTTHLAIAFDQDAAGNAATIRGLDLARNQDFSIKIITLPPEAGKDPDEAVRKNPALWTQAIVDAKGIMEWVYQNAFRRHGSSTAEQKKLVAREVLEEIRRIADPIERDHWIKTLARDLQVGEPALLEALHQKKNLAPFPSKAFADPRAPSKQERNIRREAERLVFCLLLTHEDLWKLAQERCDIAPEDFSEPDLATLYVRLKERYPWDKSSASVNKSSGQAIRPPADLAPEEAMLFNALATYAEQEFQGESLEALKRELLSQFARVRQTKLLELRLSLEQEMREAERAGDQEKIAELLTRFSTLSSSYGQENS